MKVYMVTSGCYSDYSVDGVFSTMEKAETYKALLSDANDIEELHVDAGESEERHVEYKTILRFDNGDVIGQYSSERLGKRDYSGGIGSVLSEEWRKGNGGPSFIETAFGYSTKSAEHAMKLAVESRQRHLRLNRIKTVKKCGVNK